MPGNVRINLKGEFDANSTPKESPGSLRRRKALNAYLAEKEKRRKSDAAKRDVSPKISPSVCTPRERRSLRSTCGHTYASSTKVVGIDGLPVCEICARRSPYTPNPYDDEDCSTSSSSQKSREKKKVFEKGKRSGQSPSPAPQVFTFSNIPKAKSSNVKKSITPGKNGSGAKNKEDNHQNLIERQTPHSITKRADAIYQDVSLMMKKRERESFDKKNRTETQETKKKIENRYRSTTWTKDEGKKSKIVSPSNSSDDLKSGQRSKEMKVLNGRGEKVISETSEIGSQQSVRNIQSKDASLGGIIVNEDKKIIPFGNSSGTKKKNDTKISQGDLSVRVDSSNNHGDNNKKLSTNNNLQQVTNRHGNRDKKHSSPIHENGNEVLKTKKVNGELTVASIKSTSVKRQQESSSNVDLKHFHQTKIDVKLIDDLREFRIDSGVSGINESESELHRLTPQNIRSNDEGLDKSTDKLKDLKDQIDVKLSKLLDDEDLDKKLKLDKKDTVNSTEERSSSENLTTQQNLKSVVVTVTKKSELSQYRSSNLKNSDQLNMKKTVATTEICKEENHSVSRKKVKAENTFDQKVIHKETYFEAMNGNLHGVKISNRQYPNHAHSSKVDYKDLCLPGNSKTDKKKCDESISNELKDAAKLSVSIEKSDGPEQLERQPSKDKNKVTSPSEMTHSRSTMEQATRKKTKSPIETAAQQIQEMKKQMQEDRSFVEANKQSSSCSKIKFAERGSQGNNDEIISKTTSSGREMPQTSPKESKNLMDNAQFLSPSSVIKESESAFKDVVTSAFPSKERLLRMNDETTLSPPSKQKSKIEAQPGYINSRSPIEVASQKINEMKKHMEEERNLIKVAKESEKMKSFTSQNPSALSESNNSSEMTTLSKSDATDCKEVAALHSVGIPINHAILNQTKAKQYKTQMQDDRDTDLFHKGKDKFCELSPNAIGGTELKASVNISGFNGDKKCAGLWEQDVSRDAYHIYNEQQNIVNNSSLHKETGTTFKDVMASSSPSGEISSRTYEETALSPLSKEKSTTKTSARTGKLKSKSPIAMASRQIKEMKKQMEEERNLVEAEKQKKKKKIDSSFFSKERLRLENFDARQNSFVKVGEGDYGNQKSSRKFDGPNCETSFLTRDTSLAKEILPDGSTISRETTEIGESRLSEASFDTPVTRSGIKGGDMKKTLSARELPQSISNPSASLLQNESILNSVIDTNKRIESMSYGPSKLDHSICNERDKTERGVSHGSKSVLSKILVEDASDSETDSLQYSPENKSTRLKNGKSTMAKSRISLVDDRLGYSSTFSPRFINSFNKLQRKGEPFDVALRDFSHGINALVRKFEEQIDDHETSESQNSKHLSSRLRDLIYTLESALEVLSYKANLMNESMRVNKERNAMLVKENEILRNRLRSSFIPPGQSFNITNGKIRAVNKQEDFENFVSPSTSKNSFSTSSRMSSSNTKEYGMQSCFDKGVETPMESLQGSNQKMPDFVHSVDNESRISHDFVNDYVKNFPNVSQTTGTSFVVELCGQLNLDEGHHAHLANIMDKQWLYEREQE